ncbi:conserved exported hypothetical protein [Candidatus Sulfotelmatomonas gaucii]|uniref:DUF2846 domain-containing protein n=1 Tax=Candidatus Sulfuritelmatomonas gaucii TaxID=2043161 RepID=A0A2N9L8M6_9BACT|nr:conserved exported hypothetical protein [Candidatus Sulfotelmatomonas gaucii]
MKRAILLAIACGVAYSLLPCWARGSAPDSLGAPGCGDAAAKFDVKNSKGQHPDRPDAGKALVFVVEDDSNFNSFPKPTTRAGLDGKWMGATHGNSYLYFSVDPGVHHLCASWQTTVIVGEGHQTAAAHFTAEADSVYYFEVKDKYIMGDSGRLSDMTLTPLDSDEGQVLVSKFDLSSSHDKK